MLPSRRAPIVTQMVIYKVGSADEVVRPDRHRAFPRAHDVQGHRHGRARPSSRAPSSRNGGRDNAYTDFDFTGYHQTIAADRLELVMRMEADRMANLRITEKELTPERQVVLEERRMRTDNVPSSCSTRRCASSCSAAHKPYGMPIGGYVDDVKKLTRRRPDGLLSQVSTRPTTPC